MRLWHIAAPRLAHCAHGRKHHAGENADDRDHDQQLDEGKSLTISFHGFDLLNLYSMGKCQRGVLSTQYSVKVCRIDRAHRLEHCAVSTLYGVLLLCLVTSNPYGHSRVSSRALGFGWRIGIDMDRTAVGLAGHWVDFDRDDAVVAYAMSSAGTCDVSPRESASAASRASARWTPSRPANPLESAGHQFDCFPLDRMISSPP